MFKTNLLKTNLLKRAALVVATTAVALGAGSADAARLLRETMVNDWGCRCSTLTSYTDTGVNIIETWSWDGQFYDLVVVQELPGGGLHIY